MRALLAFIAIGLLSGPALAHDLRVFASVMGSEVTVEAKFSSGKLPASGEVRVKDQNGNLLQTLPVGQGGITTFMLPESKTFEGLMIEVETGEGHEDYWLLTESDIAKGREAP